MTRQHDERLGQLLALLVAALAAALLTINTARLAPDGSDAISAHEAHKPTNDR